MNPVSSIFAAIASFFNWMTGRNATNNAAPVVAARKGQQEADAAKATADAIEAKKTEEIRKQLAE